MNPDKKHGDGSFSDTGAHSDFRTLTILVDRLFMCFSENEKHKNTINE